MKIKSALLACALLGGAQAVPASANVKPIVESFTYSPDDISLDDVSTDVKFSLIVFHPSGIANSNVEITLKNSRNDSLATKLYRTDSPINLSRQRVEFFGSIQIPRLISAGVYSVSASEIKNNASAGYQYSTGLIESSPVRSLTGAESGLLIRDNGFLKLDYLTFNGPSYEMRTGVPFVDTIRFNNSSQPIWKVGETYKPEDFFEIRVPNLKLSISTATPTVCSSDGKLMFFHLEGICSFSVSTPLTYDYLEKIQTFTVKIFPPRPKIALVIENVANQVANNLPKVIQLFPVYSPASGYVFPKSETPRICNPSGYHVRILKSGTCILSYQSPETQAYNASDVYLQTFQINPVEQTLQFSPPTSLNISLKSFTLSAIASSGKPVDIYSDSISNCKVIDSVLFILKPGDCVVTARQEGDESIAPVSKTILIKIIGNSVPVKRKLVCSKTSSQFGLPDKRLKCRKVTSNNA